MDFQVVVIIREWLKCVESLESDNNVILEIQFL